MSFQQYTDAAKRQLRQPVRNPRAPQPKEEKPVEIDTWDYKGTTDRQGNPPPAGAQGFDPLGRPYFGPGLPGTLKRYAWQFLGSPTSGLGAENWARIVDLTGDLTKSNSWISGGQGMDPEKQKELGQRIASGLFGGASGVETDKNALEENTVRIKEIDKQIQEISKVKYGMPYSPTSPSGQDWEIKNLLREQQQLLGENAQGYTTIQINGQNISLLTPVIRAVSVGTEALLDLLGEPAIKTEQLLGSQKAMRDYVQGEEKVQSDLQAEEQAGQELSELDARAAEIRAENPMGYQMDPEYREIVRQEYEPLKTIVTRSRLSEAIASMIPAISIYNTIRFFLAPGTATQKAEVVKQGWDEGRLLYSEFASPAIEQEYKSRLAAGEDPQLLAMELQNPYAEMAGQILIDPHNVIGMFTKAAKVAGRVDEASQIVKTSGLANDAEFLDDAYKLGTVANNGESIRALDNLVARVKNFFYEGEDLRKFKSQSYSVGELNAAGNRMKSLRHAGNAFSWIAGNVFKDGRKLDEVNDYLAALVKLSSKNLDEVREGTVALTHFPSPSTALGQEFLETSVMLRNLLTKDGVLDVGNLTSKLKADNWPELGKKLQALMGSAVDYKYPTVSEMAKAAETVKTGVSVTPRTQQLADAYKELEKTRPGLVRLAKWDELASQPKNWVNRILGSFYFSYNYGFATRNGISNFIHVLTDAGPSAWFRDGEFLSMRQIDEELAAWHGGQLPPAVHGFKTLPSELNARADKIFGVLPTGTSIAESMESAAAKRVYYKYFRDTMDAMLQPGRALPTVDEFVKAGFSESQVQQFTNLIQQNRGDVKKAFAEFSQQYQNGGPDLWRVVTEIMPSSLEQPMKDFGIYDEIVKLTRNPGVTKEQIVETFAGWRKEVQTRVGSVVNDLPGKNPDTPLTEEISEMVARAGKNFSEGDRAYLDMLAEAGYQAVDKYTGAIGEIVKRTGDPEGVEILTDLVKRVPDNEIRKATSGLTNKTWEVQRRAEQGEDIQKLWAELVTNGAALDAKDLKSFKNAIWQYSKEEVARKWTQYFDRIFAVSEDYAKKVGVTELLQEARLKVQTFQEARTATFKGINPQRVVKKETLESIASEYGVKNQKHAANVLKKYGGKTEGSYTTEEIRGVFDNLSQTDPKYAKVGPATEPMVPPYVDGAVPTESRAWAENGQGIFESLDYVEKKILGSWGMKSSGTMTPDMARNLDSLLRGAESEIAKGQLIAQKVGEYWRDFSLLPYGETTHLDHALSYIFPYHFWYSRSYANWAKRLASDPQIIAAYAKFKDQMANLHKDAPEWWKYNVQLPEFMWGLNNGNPMYINLEASVWPLYGLTGVDYTDPERRKGWLVNTIDDMGKLGPSIWSPINMAIAAGFAIQGETEASQAWGGRMIPQTATFKAVQAQLGFTPTELDPSVLLFSGNKPFDFRALDPHEESRALRALAAMQNEGLVTPEQAIELAYRQEGELWDEAVRRATQERAPGQIASFFLGVGFKARTQQDMEADNFYQDYFRMRNLHDSGYISDDQYKQGYNDLRARYPFMDTLLLGRRAGDGRDSAYAYNVISRIPPGMTSEIYDILGVDPETAERFYDSGGSFDGWNPQEREQFMTAMANAGAMIAIPSNATRQEWTEARSAYQASKDEIARVYGEDIQNKIDAYFEIQDVRKAQIYMQNNPEVGEALDLQNELIVGDPLLMKYYGGVETLNRYYTSQMFDILEKKYGQEVLDAASEYSDTRTDEARKAELKRLYPLKAYWSTKDDLKDEINRNIAKFDVIVPELETIGEPQNPTQEDIQDFQQGPDVDEIISNMSPSLLALVEDYFNGEDLPYAAENQLEYIADRYGMTKDELLQQIGVAQ